MNTKKYNNIILGGSFDPIHSGHLMIANEVLQQFKAHRAIFLPTSQNPFKTPPHAATHDRLAMLQLATQSNPNFIISTIEIHNTIPSFTSDTIKALQASGSIDSNSAFIIGDAQTPFLHKWREYPKLFESIDLIIVRRSTAPLQINLPIPYTLFENDVLDISSTNIRKRIAEHRSYRYLVPESVYYYINDKGLYTCQ